MITLLNGDCRTVLPTLADEAFDCIVTSPPYFGLRDYGCEGQIGLEPTLDAYVETMRAVARELWRVLKPTGTFWLNLGDCYNNFRTQMGPGQALHGRDNLHGKPAPLTRQRGSPGLKEKDLCMVPHRVALALQTDGWWVRSAVVWHKPNPMPESVTDRPTSAYEMVFLLTKAASYFYDAEAIAEEAGPASASRYKYDFSGPPAELEQPNGNERLRPQGKKKFTGTRNPRNVWTITAQPFKGSHFATMPPDLAERCIKAGCPKGGQVLDPFGGSGTTGLVADSLGRHATLIELNPAYRDMQSARIFGDIPLFAANEAAL